MTEQTTTDEFGEAIGAEASETQEQPDESAEQTANEQETDVQQEADATDVADGAAQPEVDEDLEYIKTQKNIDPSDPEALKKIAKMYRKAEKAMHEQRQQQTPNIESELQNAQAMPQTELQQVSLQVQRLENAKASSEFMSEVNPTPEEQARIVDYLKSPIMLPDGSQITGYDLYRQGIFGQGAAGLKKIYKLVGGGAIDPKTIQEQTRKQTLAEISNKQRAQRLAGGSTDSKQFSTNDSSDGFLDGFNGA